MEANEIDKNARYCKHVNFIRVVHRDASAVTQYSKTTQLPDFFRNWPAATRIDLNAKNLSRLCCNEANLAQIFCVVVEVTICIDFELNGGRNRQNPTLLNRAPTSMRACQNHNGPATPGGNQ